MFAARRVTKLYGRVPVLKNLDLELTAGKHHVVFGRNGAGKSTLLRIVATLMKPASGELVYDGVDLHDHGPAVRGGLGFVGHESFVYGDLTVRENLEFYRDLYGAACDVDALLDWADLRLRERSPARSLSRGMQQRLAIARAILHAPKLLILDEPFTGLDAVSSGRLVALLEDLKTRETTILLATHDVPTGVSIADRILIMDAGRIVTEATGRSVDDVRRLLLEAQGS